VRTAVEVGLCEPLALCVEDPQQALARCTEPGQGALHQFAGLVVTGIQVRLNQLLLAAEQVVKRRLGDASPLHDPVDADALHAFLVEQLIRGGQQALAHRRLRRVDLAGHEVPFLRLVVQSQLRSGALRLPDVPNKL
jgi:hypothetical protein